MHLKMPVGVDNFKEAITNYYVVDKTDFICQLLDNPSKVTLITRPRRFGKTLTMSMVDYFFNIEHKDPHLFEGTAVARAGETYMAHLGTRPVIFLSLKNIESMTWEGAYGLFTQTMQWEYRKHSYLMDSPSLSEEDKAYFKSILSRSATADMFQMSLYRLSGFLYTHYHRKVIILIDEYDAPLQHAFAHGFYEEAITFFRTWFNSALKTNDALDFALLTGVLRIAKESIFSGLNNLEVSTVTGHRYSDIFGFTEDEICRMARDLRKEDKIPEIRKWYDGYDMGGVSIYNPWSVLSYFNSRCHPMPYWVNTSANEILQQLLHHVDRDRIELLRKLLGGESINATLNENVIYQDIGKDRSALFTMLLTTGYLTVAEALPTSYNRFALRIPNHEVRLVYSMEIMNHLAQGIDRDTFDTLFDAMFEGNAPAFEETLSTILLHTASAFDTAGKEVFYHGFMLGITALLLGKDYMVKSNEESGYGRFDLALIPRNPKYPGILMEFKAADSEKELEPKAIEALQQIEEKKYTTLLEEQEIPTIWKYGISFCGKKVKIKASD